MEPVPASWQTSFTNSVPALMQTIDGLAEFLTQQGAGARALHHAQLAVEEIGTNIIKYGYDDAAEHRIQLRLECRADYFLLELLDDGHPFDPGQIPEADPQQALEEREPGGWGISLVRRVARRMAYERRDGLNVNIVEIARE